MPTDRATRTRLLSITQAADRLGIHYQTLRSWADKGLVPVVRLPSGYRRFDSGEIERVRREMGLSDADGDRADGGAERPRGRARSTDG